MLVPAPIVHANSEPRILPGGLNAHAFAVSPVGAQALTKIPWAVTFPAVACTDFPSKGAVDTAPSLVYPPAAAPAHQLQPVVAAPPAVPANLLNGMPDPASVEKQKAEFAKGIDDVLNQQTAVLARKHQAVLEFLRVKNEQEKRRACASIDQQVQQSELELQARYGEQMMQLSTAAQSRKLEMEKQAAALAMEYSTRRTQEELSLQDYEAHLRFFDASIRDGADPNPLRAALSGPPYSGQQSLTVPPGHTGPGKSTSKDKLALRDAADSPTSKARSGPVVAHLYLVVHGCYNLENHDTGILGDVSDPFVVAKVGKQKHQTPTINNDLNPKWEEKNQFKFEIRPEDSALELEVINSNIIRDDSLGHARVELSALPPGDWHRLKRRLVDGKEGEIEFHIRLEPVKGPVGTPSTAGTGTPRRPLHY